MRRERPGPARQAADAGGRFVAAGDAVAVEAEDQVRVLAFAGGQDRRIEVVEDQWFGVGRRVIGEDHVCLNLWCRRLQAGLDVDEAQARVLYPPDAAKRT